MKKAFVLDKRFLVLLLAIVCIHFLILSKIVYFPYPELFVYPYLVAKGLLPYKQIIDQHFPGLMFFPINLYSLGMKTPEASFVLHLGIIGVNHILIFLIGRRYFGSNTKALLSNIVYLLWHPYLEGYVLWIDSFIPVFLLSVYYLLTKKDYFKSSRLGFSVGIILGLATVFKQTTAPLLMLLAIYLLVKKKFKFIKFLALGLLVPIGLMIIYFSKIGVIKDFWNWSVLFNLTTFAQMGRKYPSFFDLIKTVWIFGPSILIFSYTIYKKSLSDETILLTLFFLGSLVFAYARFDFVHLQPALPFLALFLTQGILSIPKRFVFFCMVIYFSISAYLLFPFYRWAGNQRTFFFGEFESEIMDKVHQYSRENDKIFTLGTTPHIYFLTDRLPPGNVFVFQFPWFMVEAEEVILRGIIMDPPKVVVRDTQAEVQGMNLVEFMPKINDYVNRYYVSVDYVEGTEIMIWR